VGNTPNWQMLGVCDSRSGVICSFSACIFGPSFLVIRAVGYHFFVGLGRVGAGRPFSCFFCLLWGPNKYLWFFGSRGGAVTAPGGPGPLFFLRPLGFVAVSLAPPCLVVLFLGGGPVFLIFSSLFSFVFLHPPHLGEVWGGGRGMVVCFFKKMFPVAHQIFAGLGGTQPTHDTTRGG